MELIKGKQLEEILESKLGEIFRGASDMSVRLLDYPRKDGIDNNTILARASFEESGVRKTDDVSLSEMISMVSDATKYSVEAVEPIITKGTAQPGGASGGRDAFHAEWLEGFRVG